MPPMFLSPGEGKTVSFRGVTVICKVDAETTGGSWSLFEHIAEPGAADAPPHWHSKTDETFYVIEGRVRLRAGERTEMLLPGSCAFVPRGTLHTFTNLGDGTARMLVHVSPGGRGCTFQEVFDLVSRERLWPPADRGRYLELLARYDTHMPH